MQRKKKKTHIHSHTSPAPSWSFRCSLASATQNLHPISPIRAKRKLFKARGIHTKTENVAVSQCVCLSLHVTLDLLMYLEQKKRPSTNLNPTPHSHSFRAHRHSFATHPPTSPEKEQTRTGSAVCLGGPQHKRERERIHYDVLRCTHPITPIHLLQDAALILHRPF